MKPTAALRQILEGPEVTMGIAAHDPLLARLVQNAGFKMVAVSGNAVAASYLGMPDMGFTNLNDIVDVSRRIAAAVDLPVLVDADTGFGNAMNILRTVGDFERAGGGAKANHQPEKPLICAFAPPPRGEFAIIAKGLCIWRRPLSRAGKRPSLIYCRIYTSARKGCCYGFVKFP